MRPLLVTACPKPKPRPMLIATVAGVTVLAVGVLLLASALFLRSPRFVDRITISNPTAYHLDVSFSDDGRQSWVGVGTVGRHSTETLQDVIDQGSTWSIRFSYAAQTAGELHRSRAELVSASWRIEVPLEFGQRLEAAGIKPPPT